MAGTEQVNGRASQAHADSRVRRCAPLWVHLLVLTLAAVLPLAIYAGLAVLQDAQRDRTATEARMAETAEQLAAAVDAEHRRTIAMLEVIGHSQEALRGDLKEFHAFASRLVKAEPGWSNLQLLGPTGEHLVNPRLPFGTPLPPLRRPELVVSAATSGRPIVSDLVRGAVAQHDLTAVYVPVKMDSAVRYVATAALEPQDWQGLLESRVPPDLDGVLLDRGSVVITSTGLGDRPRTRATRISVVPSGKPLLLQHPSGAARMVATTINGRAAYVATARAPLSGWTVATVAPAELVDGQLRKSAVNLGVVVLALLTTGLAAAAFMSRRISRSILSLVEGVEAVAEGRQPPLHEDRVAEVQHAREALLRTAAQGAEQLRRESKLREQLEAHEVARNAFLAVLGHELRNPLAPLRNIAIILSRPKATIEQVRKAAAILDRQTTQLARLVDDLLDITRIQNGKIELRLEALDLAQLVRHVAADHEAAAQEAQLELTLDVCAEPVPVRGDSARLTQVFGNLLHNAFKFTPPLGSVFVRVERLDAIARVSVTDTGAGIDSEALEEIFRPFVQGPQDGVRTPGGLGLGLALVDTLVRMHGGSVSAQSDGAGKGAVFRIDLPMLDGADGGCRPNGSAADQAAPPS